MNEKYAGKESVMQMELQRNHFPRDRREDSALIKEELHHRNISKSLLANWEKRGRKRNGEWRGAAERRFHSKEESGGSDPSGSEGRWWKQSTSEPALIMRSC